MVSFAVKRNDVSVKISILEDVDFHHYKNKQTNYAVSVVDLLEWKLQVIANSSDVRLKDYA